MSLKVFDMGRELLPHFCCHSRCCLLSYVSPETWFVEIAFGSISRIRRRRQRRSHFITGFAYGNPVNSSRLLWCNLIKQDFFSLIILH